MSATPAAGPAAPAAASATLLLPKAELQPQQAPPAVSQPAAVATAAAAAAAIAGTSAQPASAAAAVNNPAAAPTPAAHELAEQLRGLDAALSRIREGERRMALQARVSATTRCNFFRTPCNRDQDKIDDPLPRCTILFAGSGALQPSRVCHHQSKPLCNAFQMFLAKFWKRAPLCHLCGLQMLL